MLSSFLRPSVRNLSRRDKNRYRKKQQTNVLAEHITIAYSTNGGGICSKCDIYVEQAQGRCRSTTKKATLTYLQLP